MFILILMLVVNLMQSQKYVFSLAMVMRNLAIGFGMNKTLNERARSMRLHAGLPKTFWADAVSTAAYLINRGPSVPMEFKLPEEV